MQTHYYIYKTITSSYTMAKKNEIIVKDVVIKTIKKTALTISALQILPERRILLSRNSPPNNR